MKHVLFTTHYCADETLRDAATQVKSSWGRVLELWWSKLQTCQCQPSSLQRIRRRRCEMLLELSFNLQASRLGAFVLSEDKKGWEGKDVAYSLLFCAAERHHSPATQTTSSHHFLCCIFFFFCRRRLIPPQFTRKHKAQLHISPLERCSGVAEPYLAADQIPDIDWSSCALFPVWFLTSDKPFCFDTLVSLADILHFQT